jgi:hypothetical protein
MKNSMIKKTLIAGAAALGITACSAGVPVPITIDHDEFVFTLSLNESLDAAAEQLKSSGLLPPETTGIPELWPSELPDLCMDLLVETNPDDGGRIDLSPDPNDPEVDAAFADNLNTLNDGLIEYIEIDDLTLRVEENSLNIPLPVAEIQASDDKNADVENRLTWFTLGTIGGSAIPPGCQGAVAGLGTAVEPGEVADLPLRFVPGGESFLTNQMSDENCVEREKMKKGGTLLSCKEFALRARTRIMLNTKSSMDSCSDTEPCETGFTCVENSCRRQRPSGLLSLRMILRATFYVSPL